MARTWTEIQPGGGAREIERAWAKLREPHAGPGEHPARALALNIVVRARDAADSERMADCLWSLGPRHPARIFLFSPVTTDHSVRLAADAHGSELLQSGGSPPAAASLISALLQADLPVVFLWHGGRPEAEFEHWAGMADRILLDSQRLGLSAHELAALGRGRHPRQHLIDLTWARLTPWRQLLCQGLESFPGAALNLESLALHTVGEFETCLAATLLTGWLAHSLDWTSPERLAQRSLGLHHGSRRVTVNWQPGQPVSGHAGRLCGLEAVARCTGAAGGKEDLTISIHQHGRHLNLHVRRGGAVIGHWAGLADAEMRGEPEMLCEELSLTGADRLYDQSLARGLLLLDQLRSAAA